MLVPELTPEEVKSLKDREDIILLDVRSPAEHEQVAIPGSVLIPLEQLPFRMNELPTDKKIVVYCRSGNRSAMATYILRSRGFEAYNMAGGIINWNYEREGSAVSPIS